MRISRRRAVVLAIVLLVVVVATRVRSRFNAEIARAAQRAAQGSRMVATRCGPIEVQETGEGTPFLMIHGSGGGHDQGSAFARSWAPQGVRVIAMSRFGYLRAPRPADASPEAQADAHVCLLDALGIAKAVVAGGSAGSPSALQTAIRHPQRVRALVLVVPIAFKPGSVADSAPPISPEADRLLLRLVGSDFLFWSALQLARDHVFRYVLATPPELIAAANAQERERLNAVADSVLPVSIRAAGLRDDTGLGRRLKSYALEAIRVPTLVVSARDDGFGTYAGAEYTASRISGARFLGFDSGGHLLVGRDAELRRAIAELLAAAGE